MDAAAHSGKPGARLGGAPPFAFEGPRWRFILFTIAIFSGNASVALIWDALPPILVSIANHYGGGAYGQGVAQLASTLPFFGVMTAGLVAGMLMERFGIRTLLLTMLITFGVSGTAGMFIDTAWVFLVSRFIVGFAIGVMMTCCTALVALTFGEVTRARMNAWLLTVGCFCGIGLILVVGFAASHFSWRAPFALHAIMAGIFLIPVLAVPKIPLRPVEHGFFKNLARLKPVLPVFVAAFLMHAVTMQLLLKLPFVFTNHGLGDPQTISLAFAFHGTAAMIGAFSYGRWAAHLSLSRVIPSGIVVLTLGFVVAGFAASLPVFLFAVVLIGGGIAFPQAALFTWAMRDAPLDLTPRALGFVNTSLYLGDAMSPIVFAPLFLFTNPQTHLLALAAFNALALGAVYVWSIRRRAGRGVAP
jgi:MFS family permease